MVLVVARPHAIDFVKDNGLKLDGIGQYNIFWGFVIQVLQCAAVCCSVLQCVAV